MPAVSKELDEETGLYYYGSRYLDLKYSRWLSGDPALGEYIPKAPIDDEAKKHNENLPGMGGVFNVVNLHVYHYAGNNPVKHSDPDGKVLSAALVYVGKALIQGGISAAVNYGYQVAGNFYNGKRGAAAFTDVNIGEVAASGFLGFVNGLTMPGIANTATKLAPKFAKRGFQALSSAFVNSVASVPATALSNGVNNMINDTDAPLLEGVSDNIKINGAAGAISGVIQTPLKFTEKQVKQMLTVPDGYLYKTNIQRGMLRDIGTTIRDEGINNILNKYIKG